MSVAWARALGAALAIVALPRAADAAPAAERGGDARVRALIERAAKDAPFAQRGLETALVALGAGASQEIEDALSTDDECPYAVALARALGRVRKDAGLPALLRLAKHDETERREAAAAGLAAIESPGAVAALLDLLGDESSVVSRAAVDGLIAFDKTAPRLQARAEVARLFERGRNVLARVRAGDALVRLGGAENARLLERALRDVEPGVRAAAADGLGVLGEASEEARGRLVEMLRDDRADGVRKQAALALGRLRERAACPALIELLASDDAGLRGNAHWALRAISGFEFPETPERWAEWWKRERAGTPP